MSSSKLLLSAYVQDGITLTGDNQHLVGLINRMRLFAPPNIINEAEAVIRGIIEVSLKPSVDFRKVAMERLSKDQQHDLLPPFSLGLAAPRTGSNAKKSLSRLGPETYRKVIPKAPNTTR